MSKKAKNQTDLKKLPEQVKVTMYDVGFGDCFLLGFSYADGAKRRILIDCGSSSADEKHMSQVVDQLVKDCEGELDALVVTHRHKDHLSAFGLKGPGEKLEKLNPRLVIQPWTEHPDAEESAFDAPTVFTDKTLGMALGYLQSLSSAQQFAAYLSDHLNKILPAAGPNTQKQIFRLASLALPNQKAITRLTRMGKKHAYVFAGSKSGLEKLLPGVRVTVLGPPTLSQTESIRNQIQKHKDEFWKLSAQLAKISENSTATTGGKSCLFPRAKTDSIAKSPSYVKWLIRKLNSAQLYNVQQIVRALDNALNNTSVILLFEMGDKVLLFPGDAQLENWQYALKDQDLKNRLSHVSLYKVGHHGSGNATPKSLWNLFARRDTTKKEHLKSFLSTKSGRHSGVPAKSLVKALESETDFHSTQLFQKNLSDECIIKIKPQ